MSDFLRNLEGWRGYLVWLFSTALLLLGVIDVDAWQTITAGVALGKGIEGAGRYMGKRS